MMRQSKKKTFLFLTMLVLVCPIKFYDLLEAQDFYPDTGVSIKSLFQSDEPLYLTLTMDLKSVFSNREEEESHPAEIAYTDAEGNIITLPMKGSVSGNFRNDST